MQLFFNADLLGGVFPGSVRFGPDQIRGKIVGFLAREKCVR